MQFSAPIAPARCINDVAFKFGVHASLIISASGRKQTVRERTMIAFSWAARALQ